MRRPSKCPLCGSKITRVTNAVTKVSYFKCSNEECNFVLGENYTDAEFYLQGQSLKVGCIKCGKPLTVANGPQGLYPRCFNCNCDLSPTFYNGKMYQKWVNAQRSTAKGEIKELVKTFNTNKDSQDELYDFDAFIAQATPQATPQELPTGNLKHKDTVCTKILEILMADSNKPMGAAEIATVAKLKMNSVRTSLLSLRTLGLVKIVNYRENPTGNHTLFYQTTDSTLPEIKTYTKKDGYNTVVSFLKENADKYGSIVRSKEVLTAGLRDNKVEPVLFHSSRGICSGYQISAMESIMNKQPVQIHIPLEAEIPATPPATREDGKARIMSIFQADTNTPYTTAQLAQKIKANSGYTKAIIRDLRKSKKIKIVGWDQKKGQRGAVALQYQVMESLLPKFKTTVDNNLYVTFKQFYKKKLNGKRTTSMAKAEKEVQKLPTIPLIINQRAYVGYSMADLKETFKKYMDCPSPIKKSRKVKSITKKVKKELTPVDVEAAVIVSQSQHHEVVSDPIGKKNSFIGSLTSFFKKKEKINS